MTAAATVQIHLLCFCDQVCGHKTSFSLYEQDEFCFPSDKLLSFSRIINSQIKFTL